MKKKQIFIYFFVMLAGAFLCACSAQKNETLPQLVIGCDEYPPYQYADEDGDPAGIDVELAQEACSRIGYEAVFRPIDWNQRDAFLEDGIVDCLWSCYSMEGREDQYEWVGPYMYSRQVAVALKESGISSIGDLEGKRIAVKTASPAESIFLKRTDSRIPEVSEVYSLNDMDEVVTALRNDYVDACAGYAATLIELLRNTDVSYRFVDEDLSRAELGIAFAKDSDENLRADLSAALREMRADGTMTRILEEYGLDAAKAFGEDTN